MGTLRKIFSTSLWLTAACSSASHSSTPLGPAPGAPLVPAPAGANESGPVYVPELLHDGLADPQAYALLSELCATAPHRLSGSADAERAVAWGQATMQRLGFENVHLEPCSVPHWERGAVEELVVLEPAAHAGERIPILALGGSVATPADGLEAEVLAVSDFEELHARAAEARSKLVLFRRPMERSKLEPFEAYGGAVNQRSSGASEAAAVGAQGALVRSMTMLQDDEPHTGALRYTEGVEQLPAAAVSTNGSERIGAWLDAGQRVRVRLRLDCHWLADAPSYNVVGEVVGRERPQEVVLIGGHLDCWDVGQGAHDDGAGCVHALEAVRLLLGSSLGRPRRTVRCVLFMNEENGGRGGSAYREAHAGELARHVLAIESDRGGGVPIGYASDAEGPAAALLERIWGGTAHSRGGGADIAPLAEFGVTLTGLVPDPQRYFDFHHSRHDVLEAVHPRELELGAVSLASLAWLAGEVEGEWPRGEKKAATGH